MKLTVTARIAGGSGLVILLLIALTFTGLSGVSSIDEGLSAVTERASPMLISGNENVSSLLNAEIKINYFHQESSLDKLPEIESEYNQLMALNAQSANHLSELAQDYPEVLSSLDLSKQSIGSFSSTVPKMFDRHRSFLQFGLKVDELSDSFEETADELDSFLFDFSDSITQSDLSTELNDLSNLVREATVTVTDALLLTDLTGLQSAMKDITALIDDFNTIANQALAHSESQSNEYFADTEAAINKFRALTIGEQSVLAIYEKKLQAAASSQQLLVQAEEYARNGLKHLNNVSTKVKALTQNIKQQASEKVASSRTLILSFALIAIIVAIVINIWVLRSVTGPLKEVLRVIGKVSDGNLQDKAQIYSDDELGKLSKGFNQLIDALSATLKEIHASSEQLSASAEQTAVISSQSSENINHQREQTDMIATAMTEMSATVDEVADSANNTLLEVQKANTETVEGKEVVQQSVSTINQLANEIENAAQVIDKLDQYSTNIGTILDVIRGIADQTNLLALNAAIEAARAGEQGRGFAVVADEVRTLASKTQESTSEIQDMIERLQSGTRDAVSVMETSRNEANKSVEQTATAGESLGKITQAVNVINDMSTHIASAAEEQSSVSKEMSQNINSISEMSDKTSQGASENLAASQELARLAEHLQQLVGKFRF